MKENKTFFFGPPSPSKGPDVDLTANRRRKFVKYDDDSDIYILVVGTAYPTEIFSTIEGVFVGQRTKGFLPFLSGQIASA